MSGNGGSLCFDTGCRQRAALIGASAIGGCIGSVLCLLACWFGWRWWKGRPWYSNEKFIQTRRKRLVVPDSSPFKSGVWSSRYLQETRWHGPYRHLLSFDQQTSKVSGCGQDEIGPFSIDGLFSLNTGRLAFTKAYTLQNAHSSIYTRHRLIVQLSWNEETRQFEGKWYVQTKTYRAENRFYLKFNQHQHPSSLYETL